MNAFAIRKTVDVKRLKNQLWDTIQTKLDAVADKVNKIKDFEVEKTKESNIKQSDMTTNALMDDLYFGKRTVNVNNVSVQSAFICMLHLANEKGLQFKQETATNEDKTIESNFKILQA